MLQLIRIIIGPILTLLALNELFRLNIEINVYTWLATLWLQLLLMTLIKN